MTKLDEFYKSVEDIFLFPGNLLELNDTYYQKGLPNGRYRVLPIEGSKRFIRGVIIPDPEEIQELITTTLSIMEEHSEERQLGLIEVMNDFYSNEHFKNLDLRLKAKSLGASGLIHVKLDAQNELKLEERTLEITYHSGLPVHFMKY